MILSSVGEIVPLALVLWDGATGMFPRAKVYNGITLVTTITLIHVAEGYYFADWTPSTAGKYEVVYTVFTDALFTTASADYQKAQDLVDVSQYALSSAAGKVMQSFTFDTGSNSIIINMWLEIDNALVSTGVSNATFALYDSMAGTLSTPPSQVLPAGFGVFRFAIANPGFPVGEYATFSLATITHNSRVFTGVTGITFARAA